MNRKIYSVSKSTSKLTSNIRKLNAKRRAMAESMIDEANALLEPKTWNTPQVRHEAREQLKQGLKLQAMAS